MPWNWFTRRGREVVGSYRAQQNGANGRIRSTYLPYDRRHGIADGSIKPSLFIAKDGRNGVGGGSVEPPSPFTEQCLGKVGSSRLLAAWSECASVAGPARVHSSHQSESLRTSYVATSTTITKLRSETPAPCERSDYQTMVKRRSCMFYTHRWQRQRSGIP
jgi:hypothetical protein